METDGGPERTLKEGGAREWRGHQLGVMTTERLWQVSPPTAVAIFYFFTEPHFFHQFFFIPKFGSLELY